jgi:hypothetical protein
VRDRARVHLRIWRTSNSYYTVLLAAKYKNIYAIEDDLGVHPIRSEWESITGKRRAMKWWSLERSMPILFIIGYAVFFAVQVGGWDIRASFQALDRRRRGYAAPTWRSCDSPSPSRRGVGG